MTWGQIILSVVVMDVLLCGVFILLMYRAGKRKEQAEAQKRRRDFWQQTDLPAGREHEEGPWRHWLR